MILDDVGLRLSRREQVKSLLLPTRSPGAGVQTTGSTALTPAVRVRRAGAAAKILTRPKWLIFHVVVAALAVTFVFLGRWQLHVSDAKHFDFFNFQYAVQWWLFATFGLFVWVRVVQHRLNPPRPTPASGGIALTSGGAVATRHGSTLLVAPSTTNSDDPVVYRGYVVPQSSRVPVRSHGDTLHDAYNNYLWQIAVVDGDTPEIHVGPVAPVGESGDETGDQGSPTREIY